MTAEDEIVQSIGNQIAKEIDKELLDGVMINMLTDDGWTATTINPAFSKYGMMSIPFEDWYSKTAEWIHLNATGDYKLLKGQWLFERQEDAVMFTLTWS